MNESQPCSSNICLRIATRWCADASPRELGLHLRSEFFDLFLQAVSDPSPMVQSQALLSLSNVMGKLNEEQTQTLRQLAGERAHSKDKETREAALYLVEEVRRSMGKEGARSGCQSKPFRSRLPPWSGCRLRAGQQTGQILPGNVLSRLPRARAWNSDIEDTSTARRCPQTRIISNH